MQVDYTGRQVAVTPALRILAEEGLERVTTILGKSFGAHVILTAEKYRQTAEVTVQSRQHSLVGLCESPSMETALRDAVAKVESQAKRLKEKVRESKRQPKEEKLLVEAPVGAIVVLLPMASQPSRPRAQAARARRRHLQAASAFYQEPHLVRSLDSVADRPMTVEKQ